MKRQRGKYLTCLSSYVNRSYDVALLAQGLFCFDDRTRIHPAATSLLLQIFYGRIGGVL